MEYTVTSDSKVCGKTKGEKLSKDDILSKGSNVEFLLATGHIKASTKAPKVTEEVPEVPEAIQQEEIPVFNSVNNEQGDK